MLSGVRLRLRTCRAAFRSESFFSGDPPDSGAGLGVSTSSSASGAADSASGSVAGAASGASGSAMIRSILLTMNSRSLPTFLTFQPFAVISVTTTSISLRPTFTMTMVPTVMLLVSHILTSLCSPKSCFPFGHGPRGPALQDRYFSGSPLSGVPCGSAVLAPSREDLLIFDIV